MVSPVFDIAALSGVLHHITARADRIRSWLAEAVAGKAAVIVSQESDTSTTKAFVHGGPVTAEEY